MAPPADPETSGSPLEEATKEIILEKAAWIGRTSTGYATRGGGL